MFVPSSGSPPTKDCDDPEIKAWLLRYGFRNDIMNEYLAHLAATTGDLYSALLEAEVDDALLDGAGDILTALAQGGPAEDMDDYPDALPVIRRFAELLATRQATLGRLNGLLSVLAFLRTSPGDSPWAALLRRYEELAAEPRWSDTVLAHLGDPYRADFGDALWAAGRLRLPVIPQIIDHLEIEPLDEFTWYRAVRLASPPQAERLSRLAERLLPLPGLANGPGEHHGFGDEYGPDQSLEAVVSGLDAFPGTGLPLIDVALRNRITRIRRSALAALSAWPEEAVPDQARDWVRQASAVEPDEGTRTEMLAFLRDR
ncbi:hypothetical protein ABZ470_12930 [Streptosporangium sp. NPDC020072]|uniref:hypothetical protein n=1 Tax=Streptosporangium sp. NPDC020072 TaxID=3154788 RepID=UPI003415C5C1